jgi:hypothetical protein
MTAESAAVAAASRRRLASRPAPPEIPLCGYRARRERPIPQAISATLSQKSARRKRVSNHSSGGDRKSPP